MRSGVVVALVIVGLLVMLVFQVAGRNLSLWLQARLAGTKVSLIELIGMRWRLVDPRVITLCKIKAAKSGLDITTQQLELHYLAGGCVPSVVNNMIEARRAGDDLTWDAACAQDLAEAKSRRHG